MIDADLNAATLAQRRAAIWYAEAKSALWLYEANGFSGYLSQHNRWMRNAAEEYATARNLMGMK